MIVVNEISINTFQDLDKKWSSYSNCRVKNVYVFFYKEKFTDDHVVPFCEKLFQLPHCENLKVDFGGLSRMSDLGLTHFFEKLEKYSEELETLWVSISTVSRSSQISIGTFKTASNYLKKMNKLKSITLLFEKYSLFLGCL